MVNENENKTEPSSSSVSVVSKSSENTTKVDGGSDCSLKKESESRRSSLISTVATIKNNFLKKGKPLEIWHQFMLTKVLYNKDYTYIDRIFCCIEYRTMVKREQIFYAVIFLLIAFVLLQNFDPLLCAIVSCLYPAYETTRSLTMNKSGAHEQCKHWLIYWIVFSFFTLQDYYTEWLTKLFSPLLLLKVMLFLMLLALPKTGIAELCHYNIVVPMLSVVNNAFVKYNQVCF
uniref:Receptor expression-enhancing protein n=1 Tax=Onchocerca volvulus TaxID=6282 RepID=A0A8R1XY07_ONCVO